MDGHELRYYLEDHSKETVLFMTRNELQGWITDVFSDEFEIENPGLDENLGEKYEFDSIDAIELLRQIELLLDRRLTRNEKKRAMEIRTINQILDYIETLASVRGQETQG